MKNAFPKVFTATAAAIALLFSHAQAQDNTPVIHVFFITETTLNVRSLDQFPLAGSIVTADASTTIVAVECTGSNIDTSVCGTEPQTLTFGSTTWIATETNGNLGVKLDCSIAQNSESAVCTGEIDGPVDLFTNPFIASSDVSELLTATGEQITSTSFSGTISSTDFSYLPVTITAGQSKLASASSAQASSGGDGNAAGSLRVNMAISGLMAGLLGMVMMVL